MELFSRYLMYIDERRFDIDELAKIFTEDVKVTMPSTMFLRRFEATHHVSSDYVFDFMTKETVNVKCNFRTHAHGQVCFVM